jgi:Leu/Phe-tRNA-protein transferase
VKRGCFPMTTSISRIPIMAVKLHHERSIVDLRFVAPHIQKKTKKISNRFTCSLNADDGSFERALEMINRRHPSNWLSPMLAQSLQRIQSPEMRMLVWEVFNADKNLVAVEIGYVHGKIYTSMTGAYEEDGAGSVQLATTAGWLLHNDFLVWDFGMQMEYKRGLGARTVPRNVWLEYVAALGGAVKIELPKEAFECAVFARTKKSRCNFETLSVGELKHTAKLLNLDLRGLVEKSEMVEAVKKKLME